MWYEAPAATRLGWRSGLTRAVLDGGKRWAARAQGRGGHAGGLALSDITPQLVATERQLRRELAKSRNEVERLRDRLQLQLLAFRQQYLWLRTVGAAGLSAAVPDEMHAPIDVQWILDVKTLGWHLRQHDPALADAAASAFAELTLRGLRVRW